MTELGKLAFALLLLCGLPALANAKAGHSEARGELLYSTHCNACHVAEIHWREQKLATDWHSLKAQVRRWQTSIGLGWSEEEIMDVAHYLNATYYGFPGSDRGNFLQGKEFGQALRKY
ncbi:MAG TPA: cytochrome c [Gallionella sp.]|nr:cytochrome c [Gallionella sp.]